jgi:hypothetical protein
MAAGRGPRAPSFAGSRVPVRSLDKNFCHSEDVNLRACGEYRFESLTRTDWRKLATSTHSLVPLAVLFLQLGIMISFSGILAPGIEFLRGTRDTVLVVAFRLLSGVPGSSNPDDSQQRSGELPCGRVTHGQPRTSWQAPRIRRDTAFAPRRNAVNVGHDALSIRLPVKQTIRTC